MTIEEILCTLEERCNMEFTRPAGEETLQRLECAHPEQAKCLKELYRITDGVGINVPGTILYSVPEVMKRNQGKGPGDPLEVGAFSFGDGLYVTAGGKIRQVDHETGEVFLEWKTLNQFLMDELSNA